MTPHAPPGLAWAADALERLTAWISAHTTATVLVLVAVSVLTASAVWVARRTASFARSHLTDTPAAVRVAAIAAVACTAYSGDTSWRFAEHHLDMVNTAERLALFAAGELALFACALMARETVRQTTTPERAGTPGVPGVLVWAITGVQLVPAFAESGLAGGLLRACFGPIGAALLWHLAMGLEIRHRRPGAASQGLVAVLAREARERALSRLGIAGRNRTAEQITRDRWTARAVDLAAELARTPEGKRKTRRRRLEARLSKAVGRAGVGASAEQRRRLLDLLAARLHSSALARLEPPSPWELPEAHRAGRSPLAIAGAELRRMHPVDAVRAVADAHPDADPAELASISTSHGVTVSPTQVGIALRGAQPRALSRASAAARNRPAVVHARYEPETDQAASRDAQPDRGNAHSVSGDAQPALPSAQPDPRDAQPEPTDAQPEGPDDDGPELDPDPLLDKARAIDQVHRAEHGRPAGLRILQRELRIGQRRAQRIQMQLDRPAVKP